MPKLVQINFKNMKRVTLFCLGLIFCLAAFSQTEIKLDDINKHIGDSVKICTRIYGGIFLERSKDMPTFLNAGGSYPNNPLTLVIWPDVRKTFTGKPEEFFKDKNVCLSGKVILFKEKPEIVIYNITQLALNPQVTQ
jgi:micrococcal nuclease